MEIIKKIIRKFPYYVVYVKNATNGNNILKKSQKSRNS